jgi:hypothetical protein
MDAHVDNGGNLNEMAAAIYSILFKIQVPKFIIKYALIQKFSIVLKRILPDKVYEKC